MTTQKLSPAQREATNPRYELHLCVGGVVALFINGEKSERLTQPLEMASVSKAIRLIERHNHGAIEFSYDAIVAYAPQKPQKTKKHITDAGRALVEEWKAQ